VEFSQEQLFESMRVAAMQQQPELGEMARRLGDAFAAQDLQTLLVDYARLFLGPMQALAKPYGSAWLKPPAQTEDNPPPAVLELYDEGGFGMDAEFMELPDHVAVELEFLYLLIFNKNLAYKAGNLEKASANEALQTRFLGEHLGAWIEPFTAAVAANAHTAFYRELAELTRRFVQLQATSQSVH
jgi:TorA maturation chaperone TorD